MHDALRVLTRSERQMISCHLDFSMTRKQRLRSICRQAVSAMAYFPYNPRFARFINALYSERRNRVIVIECLERRFDDIYNRIVSRTP